MICVGIVGCGLIGRKRASALKQIKVDLIGCFDISNDRGMAFALEFGCRYYSSLEALLADELINTVIIATLHQSLAEISIRSIELGKHVFVEKPGALNHKELLGVKDALLKSNVRYQIGYNHRYHRSVLKCTSLIQQNAIGDLMFMRARYGHGGRIGYNREWRASEQLSGGGELIDQGPHIIDLANLWFGRFSNINGHVGTYFWDMPVDDNAFITMSTETNQTAFIHVSSTEWKNIFSVEIYGKKGKLELSGLGGSYGIERLVHYEMLPEMGPPPTYIWEYPMEDNSWVTELEVFMQNIQYGENNSPGIIEGLTVLETINILYDQNK